MMTCLGDLYFPGMCFRVVAYSTIVAEDNSEPLTKDATRSVAIRTPGANNTIPVTQRWLGFSHRQVMTDRVAYRS